MTKVDSVVFDVDSTLVTIEGLDFLGALKNKQEEISLITKMAMNGDLSMREAMIKKMSALNPSLDDLVLMGKKYIANITPGAKETIEALKSKNIKVWIVTGNFQPAVGILANFLGIDPQHVITNKITHDQDGEFVSYDVDNPLSNNGGKKIVVRNLKHKLGRFCFVGDGSTDLETKDVANIFIGFGGASYREKIALNSDHYIKENNLLQIFDFLS